MMSEATVETVQGTIGAAQSYLFDAATLHRFVVQWMKRTFAA